MKCFIFLISQLCLSLLLIAQPIRFKVIKFESKWLSDNWETIYKPGDDGTITGLIDTAYKNITIDYRIPNTDGQDSYTIDEIWYDSIFKMVDVDCFLMRLTLHGKDGPQPAEGLYYKKDSDVYLIISEFNLKENYSRYQIKLDK